MPAGFGHADEEVLERYAMGTLSGPEAETLEEHLLICPACQERLTGIDDYLRAARVAASLLRAERDSWWPLSLSCIPVLIPRSTAAWVTAAIVIVAILIPVLSRLQRSSAAPPVAVLLQAVRGPGPAGAARAPRNRALILQADLSGLRPEFPCELEVVTDRGDRVLRSSATGDKEGVEVRLPAGLKAGQYWIRLYGAASAKAPIREYSLRAE
jgi:hypothetical protein